MGVGSQRPKERESTISALNAFIEALNLAKEISSVTPAKAVFGSASVILATIRDSMTNQTDYVELGLACGNACTALDRGLNGRKLDDLGDSVCKAIEQLTTTVAEIQTKIIKSSKRNTAARLIHAKDDKDSIATWKSDFIRILHIFNTELTINTYGTVIDVRDGVTNVHAALSEVRLDTTNTHDMVFDLHRNMLKGQGKTDDQHQSTQISKYGEHPPPPPRAFFGRDKLIEEIVNLAEKLAPIALVGAGGIGKTSTILTVLDHHRIKQRFGDNRRFVRCDRFPPSRAHFLHHLSNAIGAGIKNPEDLTPLRTFLSSKKMMIVLDNAEYILDPHRMGAQEIYAIVEELSRFSNICLCITSRISTTPPDCKRLDLPTLSMDAARNIFYQIYDTDGRSNLIDSILEELGFHPLSITLLATVAQYNKWDTVRLAREWRRRRTGVLQTERRMSLSATIELSLSSPMFQELGPDARTLLEVVAFFPQGIDENNLDWLFPTVFNRTDIFDKFCVLSLTYRSGGFITMLAPLRDYFHPKDPKSSVLLCTIKELYFTKMSVDLNPNNPNFAKARWIMSEDVNVEHLLNVFTTIDADSDDVWYACINFIGHLCLHKQRFVSLRPKIERLPDNHRLKSKCLFELSQLFSSLGKFEERRQLLTQILKLDRERGSERSVAQTLRHLSSVNRSLGLHEEGTRQAREALAIYERLGDEMAQAKCLMSLASSLHSDKQLDEAEEAASRAIELLPKEGHQFRVCESHRVLGSIYHSKGETKKAISHLETALKIASSCNWHSQLFLIYLALTEAFLDERRFADAHTYVGIADLYASDNAYNLGRATGLRAKVLYKQHRLEEARPKALRAIEILEEHGAMSKVESYRELLRDIEEEMKNPVSPRQPYFDGQEADGARRRPSRFLQVDSPPSRRRSLGLSPRLSLRSLRSLF